MAHDKTSSSPAISGIAIPDSALCRAITAFVRDTETDLLFNHSSRVFYFGALAGQQRGLNFNPELLYAATMFHDVGLMPSHSSPNLRFEVDGANAARDFLTSYNLDPSDIEKVWTGIALHTTPGVPEFMHPVIALTTRRCGDGRAGPDLQPIS
jgi:HD superfamily phosphodiesterase